MAIGNWKRSELGDIEPGYKDNSGLFDLACLTWANKIVVVGMGNFIVGFRRSFDDDILEPSSGVFI